MHERRFLRASAWADLKMGFNRLAVAILLWTSWQVATGVATFILPTYGPSNCNAILAHGWPTCSWSKMKPHLHPWFSTFPANTEFHDDPPNTWVSVAAHSIDACGLLFFLNEFADGWPVLQLVCRWLALLFVIGICFVDSQYYMLTVATICLWVSYPCSNFLALATLTSNRCTIIY